MGIETDYHTSKEGPLQKSRKGEKRTNAEWTIKKLYVFPSILFVYAQMLHDFSHFCYCFSIKKKLRLSKKSLMRIKPLVRAADYALWGGHLLLSPILFPAYFMYALVRPSLQGTLYNLLVIITLVLTPQVIFLLHFTLLDSAVAPEVEDDPIENEGIKLISNVTPEELEKPVKRRTR